MNTRLLHIHVQLSTDVLLYEKSPGCAGRGVHDIFKYTLSYSSQVLA